MPIPLSLLGAGDGMSHLLLPWPTDGLSRSQELREGVRISKKDERQEHNYIEHVYV